MILEGVTSERVLGMSSQELRWLENTKKAFVASDRAFKSGASEHDCLEALCKSIDTAKTLHRAIRDQPFSEKNNAKEFIEFLHLGIPSPENGGLSLDLIHTRTGEANFFIRSGGLR